MAKSKKDSIPSQKALILSYYTKRSGQDVNHKDAVDWATAEWKRLTGKVFRDPDRAIRNLHAEGTLIKVGKGVYRYDPNHVTVKKQNYFTAQQKEEIFRRDGYRCVICGAGGKENVDIHADHVCPRERGGEATLSNGQTLCSAHNNFKKAYKQTETGKRLFIRLYEKACAVNDLKLKKFCHDILKMYEEHGINGHIEWDPLPDDEEKE